MNDFGPIRSIIDDTLRSNVRHLVEDPAEVEDTINDDAILGDWVLVSQWIDPNDGKSRYFSLTSHALSVHAKMGLLQIAQEWD